MFFYLLNVADLYFGYNIPKKSAICGLFIFFFNPFNFESNNAKNINLSPRLLGVVIGQLFLCFIISYHITEEIYLLLLISIFIPFSLYATQFTLQFILFVLLGHFIFWETQIILAYFLGIILTIAINPKYFIFFIKMQLEHKSFYAKKLAGKFILKVRYSIWRDFVYDFWVRPKNKSLVLYLYNNPVVQALFGFPILIFFFTNFLSNHENMDYFNNNDLLLFFYLPVFLSLFAFILTSFRITRFLGEPQRYIEFSSPFLVVLLVLRYHEDLFSASLSIIMIIISLLIEYIKKNMFGDLKRKKEISLSRLKEFLVKKSNKQKSVIFCNNLNITKTLLDINNIFFWGMPSNEISEEYSYNNVFDEYPVVKNKIIPALIQSFKLDTIIIDTSIKPYDKSLIKNLSKDINLEYQDGPFEVYKVV